IELQNFTIHQTTDIMRNILSISKQVLIYFFIILFVYAAVSKLTDFENFQVQVAQSPLLSAFATFITYAVVIGELVIALMLCFQKSRLSGLYFFLGFMTAFTVYIFLILNYSPFGPCSCGGGVLVLGWWGDLWVMGVVWCVCVLNSCLSGLCLFLGFMAAVTVCFFLMLYYSPSVPCSCGAVLEDLGWWEHLWFSGVVCFVTVFIVITDSDTISSSFLNGRKV